MVSHETGSTVSALRGPIVSYSPFVQRGGHRKGISKWLEAHTEGEEGGSAAGAGAGTGQGDESVGHGGAGRDGGGDDRLPAVRTRAGRLAAERLHPSHAGQAVAFAPPAGSTAHAPARRLYAPGAVPVGVPVPIAGAGSAVGARVNVVPVPPRGRRLELDDPSIPPHAPAPASRSLAARQPVPTNASGRAGLLPVPVPVQPTSGHGVARQSSKSVGAVNCRAGSRGVTRGAGGGGGGRAQRQFAAPPPWWG